MTGLNDGGCFLGKMLRETLDVEIMTTSERDALWPPASYPIPDLVPKLIYNEGLQKLQYFTGSGWTSIEDTASLGEAGFWNEVVVPIANDALYASTFGAPVDGSVYWNSTDEEIRFYQNSQWWNAEWFKKNTHTLREQASEPSNPPAGYYATWIDSNGDYWVKDSSGNKTTLEKVMDVKETFEVDASASLAQNTWLEVVASTSALTRRIRIFDTAGLNLEWGTGAAASEVTRFRSGAGTNEHTDVTIPAGTRLAIRTSEAGPYSGVISVNLLG